MWKFAGLIAGLACLSGQAIAQDYSTDPARNKTHWDYSAGSRPDRSDSYEGYPPPPTQVIVSPGMYGSGGYSSGTTGSMSGAGGSTGTSGSGTSYGTGGSVNGGVGWGNTGSGNIGMGNTGRGNVGWGNTGAGNGGGHRGG
ncbi:hypothetical protein [Acetobacter oeni]|uniref:Uncharacterized protein n=1 Tax=Acetobacter oeni TaxID=304077 RepID=A0A511XLX8_9PROT|nr:hypothetical protein [Acetobacter oeni]MBB3882931.1 hypothetical protein [Acetobacter oeni]NHO19013.1 hypothetical protein [Acetobacter oeni]GBR04818.1 hypothetical protein AA21952_1539 [Acetobacter oeni LMG 21952]GEN63947.1 hypothetical protein AOE01nite_21710 [Acetobacter oeni]